MLTFGYFLLYLHEHQRRGVLKCTSHFAGVQNSRLKDYSPSLFSLSFFAVHLAGFKTFLPVDRKPVQTSPPCGEPGALQWHDIIALHAFQSVKAVVNVTSCELHERSQIQRRRTHDKVWATFGKHRAHTLTYGMHLHNTHENIW